MNDVDAKSIDTRRGRLLTERFCPRAPALGCCASDFETPRHRLDVFFSSSNANLSVRHRIRLRKKDETENEGTKRSFDLS